MGDRTLECLQCATAVPFAPGVVERPCPRCETVVPIPHALPAEIPDHAVQEPASAPPLPERRLEQCGHCWAVVSSPEPQPSCPLCGSKTRPHEADSLRRIDGVLPFHVTGAEARAKLTAEAARLGTHVETSPVAVYVPLWVLSLTMGAKYEGRRGLVHWEKRGEHSRMVITWGNAVGEVERHFPHLTCPGSKSLGKDVMDRLAPWDWIHVEPFDAALLQRIPCEHTAADPADAMKTLQSSVSTLVRDECKYDIGGDRQELSTVDGHTSTERYRLLVVPAWVGRYAGGMFAVNGRTGEVVFEGLREQQITEDEDLEPPRPKGYYVVAVASAVLLLGIIVAMAMAG